MTRIIINLKHRVIQGRSISSFSFQTTDSGRARWGAIAWMLLVAFSMEGLLTCEAFHRFGWFSEGFLTNRAVRTRRRVTTNVLKVVIKNRLVK